MKVLRSMAKIPSGASCLLENGLLEDLPKSLTPHVNCPAQKQWIWIDLAVDILTIVFHSLKVDRFNVSHDKFELKSSSKRKRNESNEKDINDMNHILKKRKVANGNLLISEPITNTKNTSYKKKYEEEVYQLIACLGFMYNTIICEGNINTLIKTCNLMKEILTYSKTLEFKSSLRITRNNFVKEQV